MSGPYDKTLLKKFNYTALFMRFYIYTCKMQNKAIHLPTFVDKVLTKYRINRGYYMAARRYEIFLRVLNNISRVSVANE